MIIGIRNFFRSNWKKFVCCLTMFMGVLCVSVATLKAKAFSTSDNNVMYESYSFVCLNQINGDITCDIYDGNEDYTFNLEFTTYNNYQDYEFILMSIWSTELIINNTNGINCEIYFEEGVENYSSYYIYLISGTYRTCIYKLPNNSFYLYIVSIDENYNALNGLYTQLQNQNTQLQTQNTQLQNQNTQLQNQNETLTSDNEYLEERVSDLEFENWELRRDDDDKYTLGYNKGFEEGFNSGEENGFETGKNDTINDDYNGLTYNDIKSLGFEEGKSWQLSNGGSLDNLVFVFVNSMFSSPINILKSYLNWNFFGINLFSLLTSLITLMLVFWVIRFFIGKK